MPGNSHQLASWMLPPVQPQHSSTGSSRDITLGGIFRRTKQPEAPRIWRPPAPFGMLWEVDSTRDA